MAFDTRLTSTDQERLRPRVRAGRGARGLPVRPRGGSAGVRSPGGAVPSPFPGQHSEYSSVGFSHLGRGGDRGRGTTIQCFEALRLTYVPCVTASAERTPAGAQPASALRARGQAPGRGAAGQSAAGRPAGCALGLVQGGHVLGGLSGSRIRIRRLTLQGARQPAGVCTPGGESGAGPLCPARGGRGWPKARSPCVQPDGPGDDDSGGGGRLSGSRAVNRPNRGSS